MFGTNGYGLGLCKDQFLSLDIKDETKRRVLRGMLSRFWVYSRTEGTHLVGAN